MVPLNPVHSTKRLVRSKLISNETVTPRIADPKVSPIFHPFIHREGCVGRKGKEGAHARVKRSGERNSVKREGRDKERENPAALSTDFSHPASQLRSQ